LDELGIIRWDQEVCQNCDDGLAESPWHHEGHSGGYKSCKSDVIDMW
jgi:hypothetical protein